ncbi:MAG: serine hydrolase [Pseudomonadales bacterium]|nr:serine hydrolase [Pseudomonadales bacterium]MDG1443215.1 serine hydrolase [Pseudomonadales bacterium]
MFRKFLLVALACTISVANADDLKKAKPESVGMSSDRLELIKPYMQAYVDNDELAGVVTLIARKGKIVHFEEVGKLNLETGKKLKKDSLFRIYSMTKPIVTTAAMMLYEEGKFQLTDPVSMYLPAFKGVKVLVDGEEVDATHEFTIRELMSHTAGLTYGIFGNTEVDQAYRAALFEQTGGYKVATIEEMVNEIGEIPLQYQPGTKWVYSLSVDVLGRLIEVVSGQSLDVFLEERMFEPLDMDDTFFEVPKDKVKRFGTNHLRSKDGILTVMDRPENSAFANKVTFFSGGGGLVSTAMDYLRYSQMMLNGGELDGVRIVSPATIDLMTRNQLNEGVSSGFGERPGVAGTVGFGLGFGVATAAPKTGSGSKGEFNWGGAAGTVFWVDPEQELTAVLMVQMMRNPINLRAQFKALTYQAIVE